MKIQELEQLASDKQLKIKCIFIGNTFGHWGPSKARYRRFAQTIGMDENSFFKITRDDFNRLEALGAIVVQNDFVTGGEVKSPIQ